MIDIKLYNKVPIADGYYLMKFSKVGGFHLVWIKTMLDGERIFTIANEQEWHFHEDQWFSDKLNIIDNA